MPKLDKAHGLSRDIRFRQYVEAIERLSVIGHHMGNEPLAIAELTEQAIDITNAHQGRDRRCVIFSPPGELDKPNLAIIRVTPSGRCAIHRVESKIQTGRWAYLISYRGHMRTEMSMTNGDAVYVQQIPNTVSRHVGW